MQMRQLAQTPEAVPFSAATEYGGGDTKTWDADKVTHHCFHLLIITLLLRILACAPSRLQQSLLCAAVWTRGQQCAQAIMMCS
jgi:hypothetical protein